MAQDELLAAGAQVLGVSVDTFAAAAHFAEHLELKFPLLGDWPKYAVGKLYGVFQEERSIHARTTFVIDKDGVVQQRIEARDPAEHPRAALEAVKRLASS